MRQRIVGLELSRPCSIRGVGDTQLKIRTLVRKGADKRAPCLSWDESFKAIMVPVHLHYLPGFGITWETHLAVRVLQEGLRDDSP